MRSVISNISRRSRKLPGNPVKGIVSPAERITQAILDGNREDIVALIDSALAANTTAAALVDTVMIPAIVRVGDLYEKKIYFLPQLMSSAEAMKKALQYLEPQLKKAAAADKGKILIATVKGDIHDIGKNIVALLLRNYGFNVIDLGKDVATKTILDIAAKEKPDVIGLSALMTTTMVNMKEVIDAARVAGMNINFILGGAVVTEAYARSVGAFFAKDGVEAVKIAEKLINEMR